MDGLKEKPVYWGAGRGGEFQRRNPSALVQMGLILSLESKLETRFLAQLLLCLVGTVLTGFFY